MNITLPLPHKHNDGGPSFGQDFGEQAMWRAVFKVKPFTFYIDLRKSNFPFWIIIYTP